MQTGEVHLLLLGVCVLYLFPEARYAWWVRETTPLVFPFQLLIVRDRAYLVHSVCHHCCGVGFWEELGDFKCKSVAKGAVDGLFVVVQLWYEQLLSSS